MKAQQGHVCLIHLENFEFRHWICAFYLTTKWNDLKFICFQTQQFSLFIHNFSSFSLLILSLLMCELKIELPKTDSKTAFYTAISSYLFNIWESSRKSCFGEPLTTVFVFGKHAPFPHRSGKIVKLFNWLTVRYVFNTNEN